MILDRDSQAIVAQCTPKGSGALALIRISGVNALEIVSQYAVLPSGKALLDVPTHTIHYGSIVEKNELVDRVMFFVMHEPHTFTGLNTVEITCHNNPFIIEKIIELSILCGARLAQQGEFAKRAFLNGKIDLIQAEAINELIHASNQMALRQSLAQLEGSFSHWITDIEKTLVKCLAFSEASFEFIEEENMEFGSQISQEIDRLISNIQTIKKTFDQQQHIRQGVRIALIGSVNAGKSSLFNALINQKRAIVTDIAGTTRDVIEAGMYNNGNYWTLVDTAGLRQTDDIIEKEGIARSMQEAQKADIVLLIYDRSRVMIQQERELYDMLHAQYAHKIITIAHKVDLPKKTQLNYLDEIGCSSQTHENLENVHSAIQTKINDLFTSIASPFLLNKRHFNLLLSLECTLLEIKNMLKGAIEYELLSCHLKDALESLTELTGKSIAEKGMDAVFREFCVGK
ncbi:MAG: tRNA uridine-5-carboxymethylaminomethyl(34) synthesis GTPase MnmE [Candidatus Babeliales bacterium]